MYHDPIVKERIRTAMTEGIESQLGARARRRSRKRLSLLNKAIHMFGHLRKKDRKQFPKILIRKENLR